VYAEEQVSVWTEEQSSDLNAEEQISEADAEVRSETDESNEDGSAEQRTGTYSVPEGWIADVERSTDETTVYTKEDTDETVGSTISCSYLDTNYSVLEYEQLRDMLTSSLLYSNVNAQISTSAGYTDARDYLFIVLVDDSEQDHTDSYYYVVGDYRCFCVTVCAYRDEAGTQESDDVMSPEEAGRSIAEQFEWSE
jgi:hypothetical protein